MSKYGQMIEKRKGILCTAYVYRNQDGGYTVRVRNEPPITINTLAGAQRIAAEIAGPRPLGALA